jgi:alpha-D-ribose 1-methylphosphonate 5-triphosphate synthase subunit PhnH
MPAAALARGLADPVLDAQRVFRVVMEALARPGSLQLLSSDLEPPPPLTPGLAAIALALCDQDTPLWLDAALTQASAVADYLRFHAGAAITTTPAEAAFALVADPAACPALDTFAFGQQDYPDRSTTVVLAVEELSTQGGFSLAGPGIAGQASLLISPLPPGFQKAWADNGAHFPRGIDMVFAARHTVVALPRSTRIMGQR